ncbi:MAG: hypothetical protein H6772_01890 [Pseudomonadales bacterium]|nr:hypothetical protein [Pseudomonadales bacterium]
MNEHADEFFSKVRININSEPPSVESSLQPLSNAEVLEPDEILTPHEILLEGFPKEMEYIFGSKFLVFVMLPKVYSIEEYNRVYSKNPSPTALQYVEDKTPFIPGIKKNRGFIHVYNPTNNTCSNMLWIEVIDRMATPPRFRWIDNAVRFRPDGSLPNWYQGALDAFFGKLRLPSVFSTRIKERPEYWQEIVDAFSSSDPNKLDQLRLLFATNEFSGSSLYEYKKTLVLQNSHWEDNKLSLDLL